MNNTTKFTAIFSALILTALYFVPIWKIELMAPQYPEGLFLQIYLTKFAGSVESINGLNHYIGMATIQNEMFPEFKILPYILGFIIGAGAILGFINKKWSIFTFWIILLVFCIGAMVDMYKWGYDYGHNLDPRAAIKVPGMAYQPPLIGYKQLLNFEAISLPDIGGMTLAVSVLIITFIVIYKILLKK